MKNLWNRLVVLYRISLGQCIICGWNAEDYLEETRYCRDHAKIYYRLGK